MPKRSHGEGQLFRRPNGSYTARITLDGRRVSKTFKLRRDALQWIDTMHGQGQQGLTYDSSKTTVGELLTRWLRIKTAQTRPMTYETYNRIARSYIEPAIGKLKFQDLTTARVQKLYGDLEQRGIGVPTIEYVHVVLHGFLAHAKKIGLIAQNWSEMADVPRSEKREMQVWDENQVNAFLLYVDSDPFYRMAFSTGMRLGELIGLQWTDLDWTTGMLKIVRQVYRPRGGGFVFRPPKTARGVRAIRVGRGMLDALRVQFSETIPDMRAVAGESWQENDLIFPSRIGHPRNRQYTTLRFHSLTRAAGLPVIRFHDIRHTAASIMLLHNEPPVRVAGILGQTVSVLLSTYSHYIPDNQETAANLMDAITTVTSFEIKNNSGLAQIGTNGH